MITRAGGVFFPWKEHPLRALTCHYTRSGQACSTGLCVVEHREHIADSINHLTVREKRPGSLPSLEGWGHEVCVVRHNVLRSRELPSDKGGAAVVARGSHACAARASVSGHHHVVSLSGRLGGCRKVDQVPACGAGVDPFIIYRREAAGVAPGARAVGSVV